MSLSAILAGLIVAGTDEFGLLQKQERISFYQRIFYTSVAIDRETEGFEKFLIAFPPPDGIPNDSVVSIAARLLTVDNTGGNVWSTVRYKITGYPSQVIAIQPDVEKWAYKTIGSKIGWFIAFIGFLFALVDQIFLTNRERPKIQ